MLAHSGAGIWAVLGALHLVYALHDLLAQPRYFRPRDAALLDAMRQTKVSLAPGGADFWTALLGFHLSHSIGALLFALLISVATAHGIDWLKPSLLAVGVAYTVIAWRCWFHIPLAGAALATALMAAGWFG